MCIIMHAISHVLSACILMSVPSYIYITEYALCPHTMSACGTRIPKLKPAQTRGLLLSLGAGRACRPREPGLLADFIVVTRGAFTHPLRMV